MKEKISCFICLVDLSKPKKANLPCLCKPYLHQKCLNMWFKHNINECPICRVDYEEYGSTEEIILEYEHATNNNKLKNMIIFVLLSLGIIFCIKIFLFTILLL